MAEVMSPLIRPSSTITMLRTSSSDTFQNNNSNQNYQQQARAGQTPRSMYNNNQSGGYRGTSATPVQPYAFQSTPQLRQETRTVSGSNVPTQSSMSPNTVNGARQGFASSSPGSNTSSTGTSSPVLSAKRNSLKDDLASADRPGSFISLSSSIPDLSLTNFDTTPKASPDRYRRGIRRTDSNNSAMSSVEQLPSTLPATVTRTASDDMTPTKSSESAKRYKRRSVGNMEGTTSGPTSPSLQRPESSHDTSRQHSASTIRPVSSHQRTASGESVQSRGRASNNENKSAASSRQASPSSQPTGRREASPARTGARSPADPQKRLTNPSPLSQSSNSPGETSDNRPGSRSNHASSPAAQHLAALSDKDLNKGMKSRLRRAFSFGTAAELRKASGENAAPPTSITRERTMEEIEQEQDEIVRRQEAAGIGAGIYSGQGGFSGSNDNLSISSTASSASLMLRKMGKGVKKGGRSLKGLFRPKSVIGVPAADGPVQPSMAQVSMVTVEAERQKVNVNANAADQLGGGTGFPKLERNSVETSQVATDARSSNDRTDSMRKSIVGSEKERAEVLASVRKGILKRSATGSPVATPGETHQGVSDGQATISPASSVPGTPRDERQSRSLTSTNSTNSNDYFSGRINGSRSMPATPQSKGNISFSPRIQFHDVWSSTEYDRRGDIATCNRLTPMLAQQIKEELNTFKMEMEVHEMSKPHTHFF